MASKESIKSYEQECYQEYDTKSCACKKSEVCSQDHVDALTNILTIEMNRYYKTPTYHGLLINIGIQCFFIQGCTDPGDAFSRMK